MFSRVIAVALAFSAVVGSAASAQVVYNNGSPNGQNGLNTTQFQIANDFTIGAGATVNSAGIYMAGYNGIGAWDGYLAYAIFADAGGAPGSLLTTAAVNPIVTDTGNAWNFGGDSYLFQFNLASPFVATPGTTYWLGINSDADYNNSSSIFWETSSGTGSSYRSNGQGGWTSYPGLETAFYLSGDVVGSVPEPGTWAMMLLGFAGIGVAMQRSRKRAAALG